MTRNRTSSTKINRTTITRKHIREKQLYGYFKRQTDKISHEMTWIWLRKGDIKRKTESLLTEAQNNATWTNSVKAKIDETQQNSKCRLCGIRDETIDHIFDAYCTAGQTLKNS